MAFKVSYKVVFAGLVLAVALPARSYFEPAPVGGRIRTMNGISMAQYPDFEKTWHLVTVRYRQDSGELRFTYANDLAFKAMKDLNPKYPEGAVFAKIGMMTEDDPAFTSSKVPSGAKRYQFMVRDQKKYKSTEGWGYALFDADGNLFDEDAKAKTQACAACHRLVPERDYVFSRLMALSVGAFQSKETALAKTLEFKSQPRAKVPKTLAALLGKYDLVSALTGEIQRQAFSGTLDEIVPTLIQRSLEMQSPAALIINEKNFSLVMPVLGGEPCQNKKQTRLLVHVNFNDKAVRHAELCQ